MKNNLALRSSIDQRKKDHIDLALSSQVVASWADQRFYYEPMINPHPTDQKYLFELAGKKMDYPIWVSSMTGGTLHAGKINERLAKVCREFSLGMGLGSCRSLLSGNQTLKDFDVRKHIGDAPLFANLGIAQLENIHKSSSWSLVYKMLEKLQADGLIIHVNPLQEWLQPEGDKITASPLTTIQHTLNNVHVPIIVKEVGQGMGPASLNALLQLPLEAIEFAALGGTNFSMLEIRRGQPTDDHTFQPMSRVGHHAYEMIDFTNALVSRLQSKIKCKRLIISGGIQNFVDGYYAVQKSSIPAAYGQAAAFLAPARSSYKELHKYVENQIEGYKLAASYLTVKK